MSAHSGSSPPPARKPPADDARKRRAREGETREQHDEEKGAGGEIQLTDGMKALAASQSFHGVRFDGRTYDCGSKLGFLTANAAFALARPDIAPAFRAELAKLMG